MSIDIRRVHQLPPRKVLGTPSTGPTDASMAATLDTYLVNTMVGVIAGLVAAAMRKGSPRRVFQDHDLDNNNNLPQQRSRSKH